MFLLDTEQEKRMDVGKNGNELIEESSASYSDARENTD